MTRHDPARPPFVERLAALRSERALSRRVEFAFERDRAAIARVRAAVLEQAATLAPGAISPRAGMGLRARRDGSVGQALMVAAVAGLLAIGLGTGGATALGILAHAAPVRPAILLGRLAHGLGTAPSSTGRAGDGASSGSGLAAYRSALAGIEEGLRRPGADLVGVASRLRLQSADLAMMAGSLAPQDASAFRQVTVDLKRIMASLLAVEGRATPPSASPAPAHGSTPTSHPGLGAVGTGSAGGAGAGAGDSEPAADGAGNAEGASDRAAVGSGNGNGNAGGNGNGDGNGDGNGHTKAP